MQLVHLAPDPRHLAREVDLVPEVGAGLGRRAQRVQGRGDDGRRGFLVVEDGERRAEEHGEEDGDGARPFHAAAFDVCVIRG